MPNITNEASNALDKFRELPGADFCKLIGFDHHEVKEGFIPGGWFLFVSGQKPWANLKVTLEPLIYIEKPDYWGIQVVACMDGLGLPVVTPYSVVRELQGCIGHKGIEIIGAGNSVKVDVPPGT